MLNLTPTLKAYLALNTTNPVKEQIDYLINHRTTGADDELWIVYDVFRDQVHVATEEQADNYVAVHGHLVNQAQQPIEDVIQHAYQKLRHDLPS